MGGPGYEFHVRLPMGWCHVGHGVPGVRLAADLHRQCGPVGWCARWHPGHARRQRAASRGAVMKGFLVGWGIFSG